LFRVSTKKKLENEKTSEQGKEGKGKKEADVFLLLFLICLLSFFLVKKLPLFQKSLSFLSRSLHSLSHSLSNSPCWWFLCVSTESKSKKEKESEEEWGSFGVWYLSLLLKKSFLF
jgi:Co/Zn/Cd efflux system component